ncbi:hypothetical protein ES703_116927 [subsurface metagenome]
MLQRGQLMVMGGEQCFGLDFGEQELRYGPGDGQPVIGTGSSSHLIHDNQAL